MKKVLMLIALTSMGIGLQNSAYSQEQIGLHFDNYAASSGMLLNPAAPFASPNPWEVNLISLGEFVDNNSVYVEHQSIFSAIHAFSNSTSPEPTIVFTNSDKMHAYNLLFIQGPSAFVKINRFSIGVFTDVRSGMSASSDHISTSLFDDTLYVGQLYEVPAFKANGMIWAEYGLNLGVRILQTDNGTLSGAINLKVLRGMEGIYFENNESFSFVKSADFGTDTNLVSVTNFNASYGYTSGIGSNFEDSKYQFNEKGLGADVGFIYTMGENSSGRYLWKFGASLVDIGQVNFKKKAGTYELMNSQDLTISVQDLMEASSANDFNGMVSSIVYGDTATSHTGDQFSIALPTAFTLQAERAITGKFFLGASAVTRIPTTDRSIYRPNIIALIPRFETKWISAAVSLEVFDYSDLHAGASIRLGPLTIGSDNILPWMVKGNLKGTDIYAGLRIFPFWGKGSNGADKINTGSRRQEGGTGCAAF